jgi:hypothetical protein
MCGQLRLIDRGQLGVHPRRAAKILLARGITRVQELAVQRLEVLPPYRIPVAEAKFGGAVAHPGSGGLAALLHRRQVVPGTALAGDRRPVGRADRLERVRRVVPAGDTDDDRHDSPPRSPGRFSILTWPHLDHLDA